MQPLIDADTKKCRICEVVKPLSEFHKNKNCSKGVVGTCRICTGDRITQWYRDNRVTRQEAANSRNRSRKLKAIDHFGGKCNDCRESFPPCVYQFHHLDPSVKDYNPSEAMTQTDEKMWKELSKCVMLCANCHMIRHHGKEGINGSTSN